MVNINIIGRLGADAEIVNGKKGDFISFRMATDDWQNGEKTTSWFRVRFNGDKTSKLFEYLKKGKLVNVFGNETVSTYQAKDGTTQISREVNAHNIEFVSVGGGQNSSDSAVENKHSENGEAVTVGSFKKETTAPVTVAAEPEDDLPF